MNESMLMGLAGFALGALIVGGLLWWLAQRRVGEATQRITHLEQARHQAVQHNSAARRQIEQLQKENGELRQLLARSGQAVPPPRAAPAEPAAAEPEDRPVAGFAPTQLIQR